MVKRMRQAAGPKQNNSPASQNPRVRLVVRHRPSIRVGRVCARWLLHVLSLSPESCSESHIRGTEPRMPF